MDHKFFKTEYHEKIDYKRSITIVYNFRKTIRNLKHRKMKSQEKLKTKVMKKEKVVPTQEQIDKMVASYLYSSYNHLFQFKYVWDKEYEKDTYYKVIPVNIGDKLHYVTMTIKSNTVDFSVKSTNWVDTKNQLGMLKNLVFPQYKKHKSIKSYVGGCKMVAMHTMFMDIRQIKASTVDELREKIKERVDAFHRELEAAKQ
jgi:hypothetical protein